MIIFHRSDIKNLITRGIDRINPCEIVDLVSFSFVFSLAKSQKFGMYFLQ